MIAVGLESTINEGVAETNEDHNHAGRTTWIKESRVFDQSSWTEHDNHVRDRHHQVVTVPRDHEQLTTISLGKLHFRAQTHQEYWN
jgi:hypothetical protein